MVRNLLQHRTIRLFNLYYVMASELQVEPERKRAGLLRDIK